MGAEFDILTQPQNRDQLRSVIIQWNANRLDLFEISQPNEDGEFFGVMRFYFQESGEKVATKCIRVSSTATAKLVIETLVEKFRPDMRMLSNPLYALYEIHESGEERKLDDLERPLLVQLNWHSDDREGRFLLKRIDELVRGSFYMNKTIDINAVAGESFKRKLSKREKKQLKKLQEKAKTEKDKSGVAEKLYTELPETSFTRSISNPEAVMRRRRQQKLEKKLAQFRSRDGGPDTGGTLKIYGESLCKDVPYKTLLLSINDNAAYVVKEMLSKYSLDHDPQQYCLFQVAEGEGEYILDDDESPLSILMNQPASFRGSIMFHVRRRPSDFHPRKRKKKLNSRRPGEDDLQGSSGYRGSYDGSIEPNLIELLPDGSETGRRITLDTEVIEVGSDWGGLQLPGLRPRHCVIAHTDGVVTLTPSSRDSDVYINGKMIYETTVLQHSYIIRFGRTHYFRFVNRARSFNEREVIESSMSMTNAIGFGGGVVGGNSNMSPPLSPGEEMPRIIRPDSILPATLELPEAGEEGFLSAVISCNPITLQFKLAPTYSLYLAGRYRATTHFRPDISPHGRAHLLSAFLLRVSHLLMQTVQEKNSDANVLAFWMANGSELLHFLKSDRQIGAFSLDAQDVLAEVVQLSFRHLVTCIQGELANLIGHFLIDRDDEDDNATTTILGVLGSTMTLLRRCRVNAALTIQLFSQIFHYINMALFNKLIGMDGRNYCNRIWGNRLRRRLNRIETWAEKHGLELAADCHLIRVVQAAHLLQAPKNNADEVASVASSCFKLNSLQLRCLLMKYQHEPDEIPIPPEVLENIIRVAESTIDDNIRAEGRHIRVEEEPLLGLAFLLPEDGYSCDIVRGVPSGLVEFLAPLAPLCRLTPNPSAAGYWTIYFQDQQMRSPSAMSRSSMPAFVNSTNNMNNSSSFATTTTGSDGNTLTNSSTQNTMMSPVSISSRPIVEPEMQTIKLQKMSTGLGLSIVAAKGVGQEKLGIYIKSVVAGGSADMDGRLTAGDQILSVDGHSLVGITQERAAEYLVRTGPQVQLEIAKQAAIYQGLATMLSQPSPVMSRDTSTTIVRSANTTLRKWREKESNYFGGGIALRPYLSDSNLFHNHWKPMTMDALSRKGLSESSIGVPRVIGSSRLLKFFLNNPIPPSGGFNAPRRMSERDLPSKILREQNQQDMLDQGHQMQMHPSILQPRIHSSKSVPALNSDLLPANLGGGGLQSMINHGHSQQQMIHQVPPMLQQQMSNDPSRYPPQLQQNYPGAMSMQQQTQQQQQQQHQLMQQQQQAAVRSRSIQSLTDPPQGGRLDSRSTPALHLNQSEDTFYQNIGFYPTNPPPPPPNMANMPVRTYIPAGNIPYSSSAGNISSSLQPGFRQPNQQYQFRQAPPLTSTGWPRQQQQQQLQQQQNPTLLRQEAKMLEMQDELRRREERATIMMNRASQHQQQRDMRFLYPNNNSRLASAPTAPPKPYSSRQDSLDMPPPHRPPLPEEYKYYNNNNEPIRGNAQFNFAGGAGAAGNGIRNPWDREEKEREATRKLEANKYWRDQQIADLEALGDNKTASQNDKLRALILEREFQRRAEESRRDGDDGEEADDDEEDDERKQMVRRIQDDLQRTRISSTSAINNGNITTTNGNGRLDPMSEERARKIEEIRRKRLELEATQAEEERLVREAQKRREEEMKRIQQQQQPNSYHQSAYRSSPSGERDRERSVTFAPPTTSPPPLVYRQQTSPDNNKSPQTSPKPKSDKKSVSFKESVITNEPDESPISSPDDTREKVREDPNRFISEAQKMLSSPTSPHDFSPHLTSGVIGSQEVYRDPRWKRLAEQQQQKQSTSSPRPEKLTFKEKMKMFAMESGEVESPKDKVKTSSKQRELETPPSSATEPSQATTNN